MYVYSFTNRRRAKDTVLVIREIKATDAQGITVVVKEGIVYIGIDFDLPGLATIMHFGSPVLVPIQDVIDDSVEELYRDNGVTRFRV